MRVEERVNLLAKAVMSVVRDWRRREEDDPDKSWGSDVVVGVWIIASASVTQEKDGSLIVRTEGTVLDEDGRVTRQSAAFEVAAGTLTPTADEADYMIRSCAAQSLDVVRALLVEAIRESMEAGIPYEECAGLARTRIVQDVMGL